MRGAIRAPCTIAPSTTVHLQARNVRAKIGACRTAQASLALDDFPADRQFPRSSRQPMRIIPLGPNVVVRRMEAEEKTSETIIQKIFDELPVP